MWSMTGFASRTFLIEAPTTTLSLNVSLRALNGRFLETTCRLSPSLSELEPACLKLFKQQLLRGTIVCNGSLTTVTGTSTTHVQANMPVVRAYSQALTAIAQELNISAGVTLSDLVQFPDILQTTPEPLAGDTAKRIMACIEQLVQEVVAQRAQEGVALRQDLDNRIARIHTLWTSLEPYIKQLAQSARDTYTELLAQIPTVDTHVQQKVLEQLASTLERIDVHEEFVRFASHLEHLQQILSSTDQEKGKRIDFLVQELLREANTLNAKCHHASISQIVVDIKVELEKMREQAQNIV